MLVSTLLTIGFLMFLKGLLDAIQKKLFVEWLLDEIKSPGFEGAYYDGHIRVAREKDDGKLRAPVLKLFLNVQAAESRHPYVEDHAAGMLRINGVQKLPAICIRLHV
jgi:hypothetical protein